jgi:stringent starvation protein B
MTSESLERIRLFVLGHRHKSLVAAVYARENGYKTVSLEHENEAQFASLILQDLENECQPKK